MSTQQRSAKRLSAGTGSGQVHDLLVKQVPIVLWLITLHALYYWQLAGPVASYVRRLVDEGL